MNLSIMRDAPRDAAALNIRRERRKPATAQRAETLTRHGTLIRPRAVKTPCWVKMPRSPFKTLERAITFDFLLLLGYGNAAILGGLACLRGLS
ncbi:MAG: hypothetical protein NXY59_09695 [Aigarchaeota archaeon]|nr:hypothetical protein [Candidatus Pelearchaeum maunauluense]